MATLSANITASQRTIRVADGAAVTPSLRLRVDDELIDFIRFEPYPYINGLRQKGLDPTRWVVTRGVGDSVAVSHTSGATLTAAVEASVSSETLVPPAPFAEGGGGGAIAVTGTEGGTVAAATELQTLGVVTEGTPGQAVIASFVGGRVMCDNGVSVAPAAPTGLILDTVIYEVGATFWDVGDPDALVAPSDGYYTLSATIEFSSGDGTSRGVVLNIVGQNEDPYAGVKVPPAGGGTSTVIYASRTNFMAQGDLFGVVVSHDAAGNLNVFGSVEIVKVANG